MVMPGNTCVHIVVVSDKVVKGEEIDQSGEVARRIVLGRDRCVSAKTIIGNSYRDILKVIRDSKERVLVLIGGTGPGPRDITVDVVESIAWRILPGFGEIFRNISYNKIGPRALISRTGLYILHDGRIVVVLPGSPNAVEIGMNILMDIVDHLIDEIDRFEGPHLGDIHDKVLSH
ncbi:MAG: molybdopterin-binding protein [Desulfurococcaceae archaeon]